MSNSCINCGRSTEGPNELCDICDQEINEMVDAHDSRQEASLVDTRVNPLFQTRRITGSIIDDDPDILANRLHSGEQESSFVFWKYVIIFVIAMLVILILGLNSQK